MIGDIRPSIGIVDQITIGSANIDATVDTGTSGNSGRKLGPWRAIRVLSGSGSFVYVDDETGVTRTLTGLASGDEFDPLVVRTVHGTGSGTPSAALTLRVRW